MHFRIVTKRFEMADAFDGIGDCFAIDDASRVKCDIRAESVVKFAGKDFKLPLYIQEANNFSWFVAKSLSA